MSYLTKESGSRIVLTIILSIALLFSMMPLTGINAKAATTDYYINIPQHSGSFTVPNSSDISSSSSNSTGHATYSNGKILGHDQGIATVTINMSNGDIRKYHVSVYYEYPQPKTAVVYSSADGNKISNWAKDGNTDYISGSNTISEGEVVKILWRSEDQDSGGGHVYQYIETNSGGKGYVSSGWISDRPMDTYYDDVAVNETKTISTENAQTDSKAWSSASSSIATISLTNNNHGRLSGVKEGVTTVTTTMDYTTILNSITHDYRSSSDITVYSPISPSVSARIINDGYVRYTASEDVHPRQETNSGTGVTISGESGNYFRIGQGRYVVKSNVYIPATSISLKNSSLSLQTTGKSHTADNILDKIYPQHDNKTLASGTVNWSSSNSKIATVNSKGKVTGVGVGTAVITAEIDGKTATCRVTVQNIMNSKSMVKNEKLGITLKENLYHIRITKLNLEKSINMN